MVTRQLEAVLRSAPALAIFLEHLRMRTIGSGRTNPLGAPEPDQSEREGSFPLTRSLHIGGSPFTWADTVVPWHRVGELPSVLQYCLVTVWPGPDTEGAQHTLLETLKAELGAQQRVDTRVVWILNAHSMDVAEALELGRLVPLRGLEDGSVHTELGALSIDRREISFAISQLGPGAVATGHWVRSDGRSEVPIGALTRDTRWLLLPPFEGDLVRAAQARLSPLPSRLSLWTSSAAMVVVWLLLVGITLAAGRAAYKREVAQIGSGEFAGVSFPVPPVTSVLDTTWLTHAQRMVTRVLFEHAESVGELEPDLTTTANPYHLWRSGRDGRAQRLTYGKPTYYWLALLSGDLVSAYEIVRETGDEFDELPVWDRTLTNTLWQSAVESLHELDFDRSWLYTQIYLAGNLWLAQRVTSYHQLIHLPQRNMTLARILNREFGNGRVLSFCDDQDARVAFGWLLGGRSWGYGFAAGDSESLSVLRERNRERYCTETTRETLDYSVLPVLSELRFRGDELAAMIDTEPVCFLAPEECGYIAVRAGVREEFDALNVDAALTYARRCSYLSDDAITDVLLEVVAVPDLLLDMREQPVSRGDVEISMEGLIGAMNCTSPEASDHYRLIEGMLAELPCASVSWDVSPDVLMSSRHPALGDVARRCRP